jgi:acyl-CoA reductase-like NAD-dependent aldehyde dehydrogenase
MIEDARYAKPDGRCRTAEEAKQLLLKIIGKYDRRQSHLRDLEDLEELKNVRTAAAKEPVEDVSA